VNFAISNPISAGGIINWYDIIINKNEKLFFKNNNTSKEFLITNSSLNVNNNKNFDKTQKLILTWLVEDYKLEKVNNKKNIFYVFDHIIPKNKLNNFEIKGKNNILNCQILTNEKNKEKSNEINFRYLNICPLSKRINKYLKNRYLNDYKKMKKIIESWEKNEKDINQKKFDEYIEIRKKGFKKIIEKKIKKDLRKKEE
jgi:homoaconitase/3-isopropylmalate dehydratase large subunit